MNWLTVTDRVLKKPPIFVIIPIVSFFLLLFIKWQFNLPFAALWFFIGGVLGIYILDIVEEFFNLSPSPFRTITFSLVLFVVSFYIITSTTEYLAKGLAFSLFLTLFLLYTNDWRTHHTTKQWYAMFFESTSVITERYIIAVFGIAVICISFLFIIS
jgi:hypothetical protein